MTLIQTLIIDLSTKMNFDFYKMNFILKKILIIK